MALNKKDEDPQEIQRFVRSLFDGFVLTTLRLYNNRVVQPELSRLADQENNAERGRFG